MNTGQSNGSQMRITKEEMDLFKSVFRGNDKLLKLMRKMFLPEIDPDAPLGQMLDLWMTIQIKDLSPEQAYATIVARNMLIQHIDQRLLEIKLLADSEPITEEQVKANASKNSAK